ncbi:hypothetical protein [Hymenobacter weizhouensis]|uniref:hypothetical protein n=1 Tax=Hymenobacter sp. YIM 151500-1 TaxID=2987689 RepID=UPI00222673F4|nr:hypothetical protein [Hymenobacter sp. YIM 151500-1]UYZ61963.1 hypothetical protein OIS53_13235 [Hymenobacter sp. YIM 151500-1]
MTIQLVLYSLMNKLAFLSLALCATAPAATAQTADTATAYKHQLGLTASPVLDGFFRNNRSLPLGLLYKRQVRTQQFLRARVVGQYSSRDTANYAQLQDGTGFKEWQLQAFIGYEWQRHISRRFSWYYGVEVGAGIGRLYQRNVVAWSNANGPYQYDWRYTGKRWQGQLRPFAGLEFAITPRWSVLAEMAAPIVYQRLDDRVRSVGTQQFPDGSVLPSGGTAFYTSDSWQLRWRPVQFIGLLVRL